MSDVAFILAAVALTFNVIYCSIKINEDYVRASLGLGIMGVVAALSALAILIAMIPGLLLMASNI